MSLPSPIEPGTHPADWQVPQYTVTEFRPRATEFAVCVFVINEGERVQNQLRRMATLVSHADIIVADGGSTDGSLAPNFLATQGVRTLLVKTSSGRLSAQMRMALAYAMRQGYAGVVLIDGNGKDGVDAIPRFLAALRNGQDHVQGSRYIKGGRAVNTPFFRHWGVLLLHAPLISIAARRRYTDTTNGFRAYSRPFLLDPRVNPFRDVFVAYELHYYLAIRAARLNFNVSEIPTTRGYPKRGAIPSKIKGWRGNYNILRTLLAACLGVYDPKVK
jgi:dolichol-phosphate mannosyltransferase